MRSNLQIFFAHSPKILILKNLPSGYPSESPQNLEPQGLAAKIFENKDLAAGPEPLNGSMVENWLGEPSRM
jgi:hypothetical protein